MCPGNEGVTKKDEYILEMNKKIFKEILFNKFIITLYYLLYAHNDIF